MSLKLYNTLTRKKEIFKSIKPKQANIYVCGPTVNDVPHLGHARSQISFDILRKYLIYLGYKVKFVSNITDIEDKIINKANELGVSIKELTTKNEKAHKEDYEAIGVLKPDIQPHATEYVQQMIDLVKILEKKEYTYNLDDGVYFNISKFKNYGKLSGQKIENLQTGKRIKENFARFKKSQNSHIDNFENSSEKQGNLNYSNLSKEKSNNDFVLWKFSKPNEPSWDSPWGKGRPGWHIECSVMSKTILGLPLDIHGGGQDLIFPHHEDEIAQSEAAYGKKFANYWVHNGMVNVEKIKMSKSLGNFKTIKDLLKDYSGEIIRYFVLSSQYRQPIDFSKNFLDASKNSYQHLKNIIQEITDDKEVNKKYLKDFEDAMNDDLNTPNALQVLWKLVRDEKAKGKYSTIKEIDKVLGLKLLEKEEIKIPKEIQNLVEEREKARREKNWKLSDELRNKINKLGYTLDDTNEGTRVRKG